MNDAHQVISHHSSFIIPLTLSVNAYILGPCEKFHGLDREIFIPRTLPALGLHTSPMGKVTIDGNEVEVQDGINIIEAAKAADVHVPHFCYHPSLTVVGQCRMCLVEVEGMPKLQAGCSTTV